MSVTLQNFESESFAAARELCRRDAGSWFIAASILPKAKRDGVCAVYAFWRMMRDAIGQPGSAISKPTSVAVSCCSPTSLDATLALFRDRIDDIYTDRLSLPLAEFRDESQNALHAFSLTVRRYQIPREYLLDLADGYRADAARARYATWSSLQRHCEQVGGNVALIVSCVLGLTHGDARQNAVQLGAAMRLTDILRDLKPDRARGRVYLPLEDLARFRYSERDLTAGVVNDRFLDLMRFQVNRARELYRRGAEGLCRLPGDGSRWTASAVVLNHAGALRAIERQGYDVFRGGAEKPGASETVRRIAPAWRLARRGPDEHLPNVF